MSKPLHEDLALILVDVQAGFLDAMAGDRAEIEAKLVKLGRLAGWLGLPVAATLEEPVATKGDLPDALTAALPGETERIHKRAFDATAEPALPAWLAATGRNTVAVAGSETDVCVLLTVQGLLSAGYAVHLIEDCVFSSTRDPDAALARMHAAGAIRTTLKTLAFELTHTVDRRAWPDAWRRRLRADPTLFPDPDDLAPDL